MRNVHLSYLYIVLAIASFCLPLTGHTQTGLFASGPHAEIIRKARRYKLVSAQQAIPGVYIDMRYKKTSASGRPLYLNAMPCLIHESTASKLKTVQKALKKQGYAIKIWDAWRPPEAHRALWDAVRNPRYVIPPSRGLSWHCYGISIDLTLVKADGSALKMPSKFDEFTARAASRYVGGDLEVAKRIEILQQAMRKAGFRTIRSEWWHFDDMGSRAKIRRVTAKDLGIKMP